MGAIERPLSLFNPLALQLENLEYKSGPDTDTWFQILSELS